MTSSTKPACSPSSNDIARSRHLALGIAAALAAGPVAATTIEVGGGCTLADAISAINTQQVAGGCPAGTGDNDTIVLPAGTLVIDDWLPIISVDMVIEGQGRDQTTVDGNDSFRPFFVRSGTVVFRDLTIANGRAEGGIGRDGGGGGAGLAGDSDGVRKTSGGERVVSRGDAEAQRKSWKEDLPAEHNQPMRSFK